MNIRDTIIIESLPNSEAQIWLEVYLAEEINFLN